MPPRVLILDRDLEHSASLRRDLAAAGHRVDHVVDLVSCIALARAESCVVVLAGSSIASGSSLALPVVLPQPRPWLIYLTRFHDRGLARTARAIGFDDVLVKVVSVPELLRRITRLETRRFSGVRTNV